MSAVNLEFEEDIDKSGYDDNKSSVTSVVSTTFLYHC